MNEVTRERAQSFLTDENLQSVVRAYRYDGATGRAYRVASEQPTSQKIPRFLGNMNFLPESSFLPTSETSCFQ